MWLWRIQGLCSGKEQLDLHTEPRGLSFIICYFISCKALANNSSISETDDVYQTLGVCGPVCTASHVQPRNLSLVSGVFKVKFINPFNYLERNNCPVFLYSNYVFFIFILLLIILKIRIKNISFQFKKKVYLKRLQCLRSTISQ